MPGNVTLIPAELKFGSRSEIAIYNCSVTKMPEDEYKDVIDFCYSRLNAIPYKQHFDNDPEIPLEERKEYISLVQECKTGVINKVVVYSPQSISMKWEEVRLFCNTLLDFNTEIVVALSGDISSQWTDRDMFIMRLGFSF